jgi:hypothetical protein
MKHHIPKIWTGITIGLFLGVIVWNIHKLLTLLIERGFLKIADIYPILSFLKDPLWQVVVLIILLISILLVFGIGVHRIIKAISKR